MLRISQGVGKAAGGGKRDQFTPASSILDPVRYHVDRIRFGPPPFGGSFQRSVLQSRNSIVPSRSKERSDLIVGSGVSHLRGIPSGLGRKWG